jgi:hypothetical protein
VVQEQEVHRHEAQDELLMVYSVTQVLIFFYGHDILNGEHNTEITVSTLIARHPPNYGHFKGHKTSLSIHPRIEFG